MTIDIPPALALHRTLSHPADTAETGLVLGFEGRNTVHGHDALVLKGDELPTIRDAPAVTHYVVPVDTARRVLQDEYHLYVLGEHTVYHCTPLDLAGTDMHTGRKYSTDVPGRKLPIGQLRAWPREAVEVSN